MNRRNFLRLSLLVPVALSTKLQVEPEKFEIISPSETFNKAFEKAPEAFFEGYKSPSKAYLEAGEAFFEGYKMGQNVVEGYAEGVQGDISSMVVTVYDHTELEKVEWADIPEDLETIELKWKSSPVRRKMVII